MTPLVQRLRTLDAKLVKAGFPAITPWWFSTIERFYDSGRRQCVIRKGRRAGGSSTLSRVAVAEALSSEHTIAPGDVGVVAIISVNRTEAAERIRLVKAILDALGVKHKPVEGGVELVDRPVIFRVYTASVAGVSGFTCVFALCDEAAKWKDSDSGANPAREVLASLRPTLAGNANAKIFLSSSPMGTSDAHAVAFDRGDDDFQIVASAPTWIARPSLTEAMCRELEPDPDTFAREYGIVPFDGTTASLLTDVMLRAVCRPQLVLEREHGASYFAMQDPATRSNAWTLAIARSLDVDGVTHVQIVRCEEWRPAKGAPLDSDLTLHAIAGVLAEYGLTELHTDQWSYDALVALASRHGLSLTMVAATQATKCLQADALKRRIVDKTIELPDDPVVRSDLLGIRRWISRNGAFSIELERSGGRHSDYAPSIMGVVALASENSGGLPAWATPKGRDGVREFLSGFGQQGYAPIGDPNFARRVPKGPEPIVFSTTIQGAFAARGMSPEFAGCLAEWWPTTARRPSWNAKAAANPAFRKAVISHIGAST